MSDSTPAWTTEKIREAFIYDGGESEYYDPINGAKEQRRMAGAIFDAWLAEHDRAVLEAAAKVAREDPRKCLACNNPAFDRLEHTCGLRARA